MVMGGFYLGTYEQGGANDRRGNRGKDQQQRKGRTCTLCRDKGGEHKTTCRGMWSKKNCEYYNEDGSLKNDC